MKNNSHLLTPQLVASLDKIFLRGNMHSSFKKLTSPMNKALKRKRKYP